MAAATYLLLPITGLFALAFGRSARVRAHAAQSIAFGLVWAVALVIGSVVAAPVTRVVFVAGAVLYLVLIVTTAAGRDLLLGVFARYGDLERD